MRRLSLRKQRNKINENKSISATGLVSSDLSENQQYIRQAFGPSADVILRVLRLGTDDQIAVLIAHIDGLIDDSLLSTAVIKPICLDSALLRTQCADSLSAYNTVRNHVLGGNELTEVSLMQDVVQGICQGSCAIMVEGNPMALILDLRSWQQRSITEPVSEPSVRGVREGFVETFRTNTSILRRHIMDPRLRIEETTLGEISHTAVGIVYIQGVAKENVVQEIRERITRIKTDSMQGTGMMEEYIEDAPWSPFPTLLRTERVDRAVGALLQGRVLIVIAGTPFVLIAPVTLTMFLTAPDDYFERFPIGSLVRLLRMITFLLSLTLPAIYVAIITYHQEMLPTSLVLAIAAQREGVPFPAAVEAFILDIGFEIFREASIRVPIVFGPAVSILGVLFLGQTAVSAGLVSPFMVIVVSVTAIASLGVPIYSLGIAARLMRFPLLFLGASLGLFGVIWGLAAIIIHLMALRSFGVPYLEPFGPVVVSDIQDAVLRTPWWSINKRPTFIAGRNKQRQVAGQKSGPPPAPPAGRQSSRRDER
ncbi:MAG: spore germination protein [Candidatus Saccharibacteria bacterium]